MVCGRARAQRHAGRSRALSAKHLRNVEEGAARNTVPGQFAEWFDGGSLTNRGMYLSPWTGAKYLWAVAETLGSRRLSHQRPPALLRRSCPRWHWTAAVRVHWGGRRRTYVIDQREATIFGDMREASAEEPYRVVYAGRDVSDEVTISPVEVGAIAFEDEHGGVRIFRVQPERPRAQRLDRVSRPDASRRRFEAGELAEIADGAPATLDADSDPGRRRSR